MEFLVEPEKDEEVYALENELKAILLKNYELKCYSEGNQRIEKELQETLSASKEEAVILNRELIRLQKLANATEANFEM